MRRRDFVACLRWLHQHNDLVDVAANSNGYANIETSQPFMSSSYLKRTDENLFLLLITATALLKGILNNSHVGIMQQ